MSVGRFARAIGRLHQVAHRRLSDAVGDFHPQQGVPVQGLDLQVDRNLSYEGPNGTVITDTVGITVLASDIPGIERGDRFVIGCERFQVDSVIADDGHAITAATTIL